MKILFYCQHVLGIGHFFRSLAICRALAGHHVSLVVGGPDVDLPLPAHVRTLRLPGLRMDQDFSALLPVTPGGDLDEIKTERRAMLLSHFHDLQPDIILVELYPFGRKAFRFELDPLLEAGRARPGCRIVCSLRDILVEKKKQQAFEERAVTTLNRFFDLLLVHADPRFIRLGDTFGAVDRITIPIHHTGFVTEIPPEGIDRRALGARADRPLIVVSAGGGSVGGDLLMATAMAGTRLHPRRPHTMRLYTGPYLDDEEFAALQGMQDQHPGLVVRRFTNRFPAWLRAADLSVSMAGYNTTMNLVATGVPALVYPFAQNREQRLRAAAFHPAIEILEPGDLAVDRLAERLADRLERGRGAPLNVNLDGAAATARFLTGE